MSSDRPVDEPPRAPAVIRQFADLDELSGAVADEFCQIASQAIAVRGRCTVVLAGGSTPRRLYGLLASEPFRHRVRWDNIEFFWGDDRAVPPDHDNSNFGMVRELLLEPLAIPAAHIHRIPSEQEDLEAAASAYEKEVARVFDVPAGGAKVRVLVLKPTGPRTRAVILGTRSQRCAAGRCRLRALVFPRNARMYSGKRLTYVTSFATTGPTGVSTGHTTKVRLRVPARG